MGWPTSQHDVKSQAQVSDVGRELADDGQAGRVGEGGQEAGVGVEVGGSGACHAAQYIVRIRY